MIMNKIFMAALAASTVLAACSSGGSNSSDVVSRSGNSDAQKVLAVDAGTAAMALDEGMTLRASQRASSQWTRNFDTQTAVLSADSSATISRNDAGGLDLTIGGQTFSFSSADVTDDGYGFQLPDGSAGIWTWSADSMAAALDPAYPDHQLVFDYYADFSESGGVNGFAVIGTEAAVAALANLPTATFSGYTRIRLAPQTGFTNWDNSVSEAEGDVSLTANFGSGTVSGAITNIGGRAPFTEDPDRTWTALDGEVTMAEAAITGNGFTGGLSGDAAFNANVGTLDPGSSYSGTFFGENADEVAGGINVTGADPDGGKFLGFGFWRAYKN